MRVPVKADYASMTDSEFRLHVLGELDALKESQAAQSENLQELLAILRASRMGAAALKWIAGLALTGVGIWAAMKGRVV